MKISKSKRILRAIINPYFGIYALAHKFVQYYEGFSYKFESNGERNLQKLLGQIDNKTVFDVGANVGDWTAIALSYFPNAKVHSFELSEKTFKTLSLRHRNDERVCLNNVGLSDTVGEFEYKDYGVNSGVNTLIGDADFHDRHIEPEIKTAKIKTGNSYCQLNDINEIDFLKIDVEGAEHLVLRGFSELLEKGKIKVIQFEYGYTHADAKFLIKDFYKLLEGYGYALGPLKPSGVLFMEFDYALNGFNSGPNYVAVHKSHVDIINLIKGSPLLGFPRR